MNTKYNKTLRSLSVCALTTISLGFFSSCDNIKEEDRYIDIEINHSEKVVLLEEYTGQRCVNCPDGAAIVNTLHETYGENFVAVGLHPFGDYNTQPIIPRYDFRTDAATAIYERYKTQGFPAAMIDRCSFNGSVVQANMKTWAACVMEQINKTTAVNLSLTLNYPAIKEDGTINADAFDVSYDVQFTNAVNDEVYLQLWVVENKIIAPQATSTGNNMKYEHNHVLRDAINGYWGEQLKLGGDKSANWSAGDMLSGKHTYQPNADWNKENLQVIGFLYRKSDGQVMQAAMVDVHAAAEE